MHCAGHQPAAAVRAATSPCSQLASSSVCRRLLGTLRSRISRRTSPSAACIAMTRASYQDLWALLSVRRVFAALRRDPTVATCMANAVVVEETGTSLNCPA